MAYQATIHGGLTNTHGSCPGCGAEVPRLHAWNPKASKDAYDCPRCGTFEYTTDGAQLPVEGAPPVVETRFTIADRAANLATVLDPVDCVT